MESLNKEFAKGYEIGTINRAIEFTVVDAIDKICEMNWGKFGITTEQVIKSAIKKYPVFLRSASKNFPLNVVDINNSEEVNLLTNLPKHMRSEIEDSSGKLWNVLYRNITFDEAVFIRDILWLYLSKDIAEETGVGYPELLFATVTGTEEKEEIWRDLTARVGKRMSDIWRIGEFPIHHFSLN